MWEGDLGEKVIRWGEIKENHIAWKIQMVHIKSLNILFRRQCKKIVRNLGGNILIYDEKFSDMSSNFQIIGGQIVKMQERHNRFQCRCNQNWVFVIDTS